MFSHMFQAQTFYTLLEKSFLYIKKIIRTNKTLMIFFPKRCSVMVTISVENLCITELIYKPNTRSWKEAILVLWSVDKGGGDVLVHEEEQGETESQPHRPEHRPHRQRAQVREREDVVSPRPFKTLSNWSTENIRLWYNTVNEQSELQLFLHLLISLKYTHFKLKH